MKHSLLLATFVFTHIFLILQSNAQSITLQGPAGSGKFGTNIVTLSNGNYVIADPEYDEGPIEDVGAVYLYNGITHELISTLKGSTTGDQIGTEILPLSDNLYAVTSITWSNGTASEAGAITWCSSTTGIDGVVSGSNSLLGASENDHVGYPLQMLSNGKYVLATPEWDNGLIADVGAVTLIDVTAPPTGEISTANSMVGSSLNDRIGINIAPLKNGNFAIFSPFWDNNEIEDAGAVTWIPGSVTILTGEVTTSNSLYGTTENDMVGLTGNLLFNGNFLIISPFWSSENAMSAGAVTWVNGSTGATGPINAGNSLVGSSDEDVVGINHAEALPTNSNYVVSSPQWDNGDIADVGAVTWASGATGITGEINETNSLIGTNANDQISSNYVTPLSNGNYVVVSPNWKNGTEDNAGAVTWANGTTGITDEINSSNSLVGSLENDWIGSNDVYELTNGNYVVASPRWNNGTATVAGAATWGNGTTGITGAVSAANSLVGTSANDEVGNVGIAPLLNGNYVVGSTDWNSSTTNKVGAVTWGNGDSGTSGVVSSSNSLTGTTKDDFYYLLITPLQNGNYVIATPYWNNGAATRAGAVTWANGSASMSGEISSSISLIGTAENDLIGDNGILDLPNGNYIVPSPYWNNGSVSEAGAITWSNGTGGTVGEVSIANSLVGTSENDRVSQSGGIFLENGNAMLASRLWDNNGIVNAGALTFISSSTSTTGTITDCNSYVGTAENSGVEGLSLTYSYNRVNDYLVLGKPDLNEVVIYNPTFKELAVNEDELATTIAGSGGAAVLLINDDCRIIASLTPQGSHPVSGVVNARVWVDEDQASKYLKRHYEITPDNDAADATASVTLYFTQAEFNAYNTQIPAPALLLPENESDANGKENLLIEKLPGKSLGGSGKPTSYTTGLAKTIDPDDEKIVWNATANRWEVTFDVTGFSGLFVKTSDESLPVRLVNFSAKAQENNVLLQWNIADAINFSHFEIERSTNGKQFKHRSNVVLQGTDYQFTDAQAAIAPVVYYRIKMVDLDGTSAYSRIESVRFKNSALLISGYPNPFGTTLTIASASSQTATVTNLTGRTIASVQLAPGENELPTSNWPTGLYFVHTQNGDLIKVIKE